MEFTKETEEKIEELQILEKNLQGMIMQKQTHQIELNEIANALEEIKKSNEIYRILGGVLIKVGKEDIQKELEEKKKIMSLRIDSIEKQEELLDGKASQLRNDINEMIKQKTKKK